MPHLGDGSMESIVSDSIRCGLWNGGYRGSDQGESGVQGQVSRFQSFRVSEFQRIASGARCISSSGERQKNAGLKAATLISVSNPVSQVLW